MTARVYVNLPEGIYSCTDLLMAKTMFLTMNPQSMAILAPGRRAGSARSPGWVAPLGAGDWISIGGDETRKKWYFKQQTWRLNPAKWDFNWLWTNKHWRFEVFNIYMRIEPTSPQASRFTWQLVIFAVNMGRQSEQWGCNQMQPTTVRW